MKFIDMFCGIGTIRMGMEQAGHECVYSIEWDKHKRKIYSIIFGGEPDGADIRAVDGVRLPKSDCWCFGAPCQDFSIAGKREGLEGDRSSLVREVFRLLGEIEEEHRPEWLLYENVKGMLSSNKGLDYLEILIEMGGVGYDIEWQLLNSKDFGVPQNRERVFTLGHLRIRGRRKIFPISGINSETALKQVIPGSDAQRVYDSEGLTRTLKAEGGGQGAKTGLYIVRPCSTPNRLNKQQNGRRFKEDGEPMFTLTTQDVHGVMISEATKKGYTEAYEGDSINLTAPTSKTRRGRVGKGVANTLDTGCNQGTLMQGRIRRLTPKECWRLQGIDNEITDKVIQARISDTQMYRAAGDACTVNVIYEIAKRLDKIMKVMDFEK
jgi:DNA (cytosine-5)-methyltransferase 1